MRLLIVFIVSLLMIPCVFGSGLRVDINSINQTGFPEIDVNFTVFDTSGRVLQDIQRKILDCMKMVRRLQIIIWR